MNELYYITDGAVQAVARLLGDTLHTLSLGECERLTDEGMVALAVGCGRQLRSLRIAGCCDGVTDLSGKRSFLRLCVRHHEVSCEASDPLITHATVPPLFTF
jgi:hypothetical protein